MNKSKNELDLIKRMRFNENTSFISNNINSLINNTLHYSIYTYIYIIY